MQKDLSRLCLFIFCFCLYPSLQISFFSSIKGLAGVFNMMFNPFKCYCILAFKYNKYITEQLKNQLKKGYNLVTIWLQFLHILSKKQHCLFFRKNFSKPLNLELTPCDTIRLYQESNVLSSYSDRHILKRRITMYLEKINSPSVIKNQGGSITQSVIICRR